MDNEIPVYLAKDQIVMLYKIISTQFDAKGYESSQNLINICDSFKLAIDTFIEEEE
tara:strand:- start:296 stop:463 length:168 start_codon:yes stop_codon:yes gene_type:complete